MADRPSRRPQDLRVPLAYYRFGMDRDFQDSEDFVCFAGCYDADQNHHHRRPYQRVNLIEIQCT